MHMPATSPPGQCRDRCIVIGANKDASPVAAEPLIKATPDEGTSMSQMPSALK